VPPLPPLPAGGRPPTRYESVEERSERLVSAINRAGLDGLLAELEPPIADMVTWGADEAILPSRDPNEVNKWYRSRKVRLGRLKLT
jgi:hypothetical protein